MFAPLVSPLRARPRLTEATYPGDPRKSRCWTTHLLGWPPRERKRLTLAGTYLHRRGDDVPYFWKEMTHLLTEKKRRTLIIERNDVPWDIKRNDVPLLLNETTYLGEQNETTHLGILERNDVP